MTAHIFSGHADAGLPMGHVDTRTPGAIAFGYGDRSLRLGPGNAAADSEAANAWRLADIRCGWPTLPVGVAAFLPPALALESLGAVSLGKGCYPGQEIVARLHYRGGHKTRMYHVRGPRPLEVGTAAHSDGGPIRVLACAMAADGKAEALVVASQNLNNIFNILEDKYEVISRYDP
jgi:folate-binding protein YgfZ